MRRHPEIVLVGLLAACVWRGYDRVLTIHLDVLSGMADKIISLPEAGRRPSSNDMTEMLYPLERGRLFLRQYESRKDQRSYQQFAALLDQYAALARAIDDARTDDTRWARLVPRLSDDARQLHERVASIRALLASGA